MKCLLEHQKTDKLSTYLRYVKLWSEDGQNDWEWIEKFVHRAKQGCYH